VASDSDGRALSQLEGCTCGTGLRTSVGAQGLRAQEGGILLGKGLPGRGPAWRKKTSEPSGAHAPGEEDCSILRGLLEEEDLRTILGKAVYRGSGLEATQDTGTCVRCPVMQTAARTFTALPPPQKCKDCLHLCIFPELVT